MALTLPHPHLDDPSQARRSERPRFRVVSKRPHVCHRGTVCQCPRGVAACKCSQWRSTRTLGTRNLVGIPSSSTGFSPYFYYYYVVVVVCTRRRGCSSTYIANGAATRTRRRAPPRMTVALAMQRQMRERPWSSTLRRSYSFRSWSSAVYSLSVSAFPRTTHNI